ncbi:MAG: right-handed parallel beta-helix repeat-containing protein [Candidatus Electrothrix sp. AR1]|nr:right-handed parallel beta-helix repeat-containing protein [Candidatus Electrothrix sp. AR1]
MKNVVFDGSAAEHALHIVKSDFNLINITFRSAKFNGFAADFASGSVDTSSFQKTGSDGAVFSGTDAKIYMSTFSEIGREAIAAGESGNVHAEQCTVKNAGIGIAVRDGAQAILTDSVVDTCRLSAAVTYRQKSFFDMPGLVINNSRLGGGENTPILRQPGTLMTVDGQEAAETEFDLKNLYPTGIIRK